MPVHTCPQCGAAFETLGDEPGQWLTCVECRKPFRSLGRVAPTDPPEPDPPPQPREIVYRPGVTRPPPRMPGRTPRRYSRSAPEDVDDPPVRVRERQPAPADADDDTPIRTQPPARSHPVWVRLVGMMAAGGLAGAVFGALAVTGVLGKPAAGETRHALAALLGGTGGVGVGMVASVFLRRAGRG